MGLRKFGGNHARSARQNHARTRSAALTAAATGSVIEALERRLQFATIAWDGGPTGNGTSFTDPVNWAGDVLPGPADTATIGPTGSNPRVDLAGNIELAAINSSRALRLSGTLRNTAVTATGGILLEVAGGRLDGVTLTGDVRISGTTNVPGALTVNGSLVVAGALAFVIDETGSLTLNGTATLGDDVLGAGVVQFYGNQTLRGNGTVIFANANLGNGLYAYGTNPVLTLAAGITVRGKTGFLGYSSITNGFGVAGATVVNKGTIAWTAGTAIGDSSTLINDGSITVDATGSLSLGGTLKAGTGTLTAQPGAQIGTLKLDGVTLPGGMTFSGYVEAHHGLTVNGDLAIGRNLGLYITADASLALNGTATIGDAQGSGFISFEGNQTLGGTGAVVFGSGDALNGLYATGTNPVLTIGPGITIRGKTGWLGYQSPFGPGDPKAVVVNRGRIEWTVGTVIRCGTTLTNNGTITVDGASYLTLLGTLKGGTGALITQPGARIDGRLDGVTVSGGFHAPSDVTVLNGLTVNGDLSVAGGASITIGPGGPLTLNGTATLGDQALGYGLINFQGSQTLAGTGMVIFATTDDRNGVYASGSNPVLTIGPGITVRGRRGTIGYHTAFALGSASASVVNKGTIRSDVGGSAIYMRSSLPLVNTGTLAASSGGTLSLNAPLVLDDPGRLAIASSESLEVNGGVTGATRNVTLGQLEGTLRLGRLGATAGAATPIEAMGRDIGTDLPGFTRNFVLGRLELTGTGFAKLVDFADNSDGATPEALYVNTLVVPAGVTLDLNGLHLYARAAQIDGTVTGGLVRQPADGGALLLGAPQPGKLATVGELDQYTFAGRAGRNVTVQVNPGASPGPAIAAAVTPTLDWASVTLVAPDGSVLASGASTSAGQLVALPGIALSADGTYKIQVRAAAGHSGQMGNYVVGAYDSTTNDAPLLLNRPSTGTLRSVFTTDRWNLALSAGEQIRFDLLATSAPGLTFSLVGPGGYQPFSGLTGDSDLVTIPAGKGGTYSLSVRGGGDQAVTYTFVVLQTSVAALAPNTTATGTLAGSGDAQLFKVSSSVAQSLLLRLNDANDAADVNELYVKRGLPPTRADYDFAATAVGTADQTLLVPNPAPGDWYVLVYGNTVPAASAFTLQAVQSAVFLFGSTTSLTGAIANVQTTITGAGFVGGTSAALVNAGGQVVSTGVTEVDSFSQLTTTFDLRTVPQGTYGLRVTVPGGEFDTLAGAMTVLPAGQGKLETRLIMPSVLGRHANATIYVEYANTGNAPLAAPLIRLQSADADDSDHPLLTLDQSKVVSGFWTSATPDGFAESVQILASGSSPGVLNPGERVRVPVYYGGLKQSWNFNDTQVEMELRIFDTANTDPVPWNDLKTDLKPTTIREDAWDVIFANLVTNVGPTWGAFVQMLSENAQFLAKLGNGVGVGLLQSPNAVNTFPIPLDVSKLWSFELQQAIGFNPVRTLASSVDASVTAAGSDLSFGRTYALSIDQRFETSVFGRGWSAPWQTHLTVDADGSVNVFGAGGSRRRFQPDSRSNNAFFALPGDSGVLSRVAGGVYELRESDGSFVRFNAAGQIDYGQDANLNRVTAGYSGGRLTSLTHSSGASLAITYNGAGLVGSIADSAGRTTTYGYDASNTFLTSVTAPDGQVTTYTYDNTAGSARRYALTSVRTGGVTQNFAYDSRGRLLSSDTNGNSAKVEFAYDTAGRVSVTDAGGGTTSLFYDDRGLLSKVTDPFGNVTTSEYGADLRVSQVVDPTGQTQSFTWCSCGSMTSSTDQLGNTTTFTYDWVGPNNTIRRMTSFTDALGRTTRYTYDTKGNLLKTIYVNGSVEQTTAYDPAGDPLTYVNRRGQVMSYTYNAGGQVTRQTFNDGSFIDLAYDLRGNLTKVTEPGNKVTTYEYDAGDRLTKVTYPQGRFLAYTYDAAGRRATMTDQLGYVVRYAYDAAGRLFKLTDTAGTLVVQYSYDAAGRLSRKDNGNGTFTTYAYDLAGQVLSIVNRAPQSAGGGVNSRFDYTYDPLGRRTTMTTIDGKWTYGYDATGQLIRAVFVPLGGSAVPAQDLTYVYDAVGNRVRTVENGVATEYTKNDLNQYTHVGADTLVYDSDGNLIERSGPSTIDTYNYDEQSRLIHMSTPGVTEFYSYDVFSNRVSTEKNAILSENTVDPLGVNEVIGEYSSTGDLVFRFDYGDGLVRQVSSESGADAFFDYDELGSTVDVTDHLGTVKQTYTYAPFGILTSASGTFATARKYLASYGVTMSAGGLNSMGLRWFSSDEGRFTSIDPLRLNGGDNDFYRYGSNSPMNAVDPYGLKSKRLANRLIDWANQGWNPNTTHAQRYPLGDNKLDLRHAYSACRVSKVLGFHVTMLLGIIVEGYEAVVDRGFEIYADTLGDLVSNDLGALYGTFGGDCGRLVPPSAGSAGPAGGDLGSSGSSNASQSQDPNGLHGPVGEGAAYFVRRDAGLPYRIDFENYGPGSKEHDGTSAPPSRWATAPAQRVEIANTLPAQLDLDTFALTGFGFGDVNMAITSGGAQHSTQAVSITHNGKTFQVLFEAELDRAARTLRIVFQSLDPATLLPPDVLTGFLPPEDGTGRGKGFVSYVVNAVAGLPTGTEIRNVALISFDKQLFIATDQIDPLDPSRGVDPARQALVTIDAGAPTSQVGALPPNSPKVFPVSWAGQDDAGGSGVGSYDVFVSDNGGAFQPWLSATVLTQANYTGTPGHTYRFYSVARDNVGNAEPAPAVPDAQTAVPASGPAVVAFVVDSGIAQRSRVRSLTVVFDRPVSLAAGAVTLQRLNSGGSGANDNSGPSDASSALGTPTTTDGGKTWSFPLLAASPFVQQASGVSTGSLVDGIYTLRVDPAKATANGIPMLDPATLTFHRLFGDINGDAAVNPLDYVQFRNAFGKSTGEAAYNVDFDFNNDGAVNPLDYLQFRSRFGKAFTY